ncbi:MAG: carbohydrate kinase, partial [Planctomycetes bacterium]|nr:carbohydrate kinase [Planctomycetota bacterium]
MKKECIKEIIAKIKNVKVAVYGDFCLDAYWMLDPRGSEVSVETGLQAGAVARHYYSLGGASNVVANLAALCPASIKVIGVLGDDIFGREITRQFETLGVDTADMVIQKENFNTVTFGKQYLKGNEQPRIDFGFFNKRSLETDQALLTGIEKALQSCDSMIINQQVPGVMDNDDFVDGLNRLLDKYTDKVVLLDSRHYGSKFKNLCRKTNDLEAALLNGANAGLDDVFTREDIMRFARNLYAQSNKPVFVTRGLRGMITVDDSGIDENPGIQLMKKLDTVGAGDTVTSALALCLGGDVKSAEAASFANFAAAVTVQKLFQTGTASGDEIIAVGQDPDYVYQPELACDMRKAVYFADSEVEYCYENITIGNIKHAVFDHDGTISTLRQGWEEIMVPAMLKAILGDEFETADEALYHK